MLNDEAKDRLLERLNEVHDWPSVYMFKFVMEPDASRLEALRALFPAESEVLRRFSSGGKYLSVTIREVMLSAEDVVLRYEQVGAIGGVIML
jgi:putative lipoic acid-binding regulatory protein